MKPGTGGECRPQGSADGSANRPYLNPEHSLRALIPQTQFREATALRFEPERPMLPSTGTEPPVFDKLKASAGRES
jgi:hypothetical protein